MLLASSLFRGKFRVPWRLAAGSWRAAALVTLMSRQRVSSYFEVRSDVTPRSSALGLTTSFVFSAFAEECQADGGAPQREVGAPRETRSIHGSRPRKNGFNNYREAGKCTMGVE